MRSGLENFLNEGVISEVVGRLMSGKEADVYVVRYGDKVVAAKVYKDRAHRSFKNNSSYKEGRSVRNSRSQRAIDRGSKFGKGAAEDAWKYAEVDALYKLHAANVRVPTPVMYLEGVLLMTLVLDANGQAAPRLIDAELTVAEANAAYHDMLGQLVRILACDLIHGDLSPYNVLWGVNGATIIDFPQIVSAAHNTSSERFFLRDARNILGHFASIDRTLNARSGDAAEIWQAYIRRELTPDFLPRGRPHRPEPRPRDPGVPARHANGVGPPAVSAKGDAHPAGPQGGSARHSEQRPPHFEGRAHVERGAAVAPRRPEGAHPHPWTTQRRSAEGPEVIVRSRASRPVPPAAGPRGELMAATPATTPLPQASEQANPAPAGRRRRRRHR